MTRARQSSSSDDDLIYGSSDPQHQLSQKMNSAFSKLKQASEQSAQFKSEYLCTFVAEKAKNVGIR